MFERVFSVSLPNGQGPLVTTQELYLPNTKNDKELAAWLSNFGSSNAYIMEGQLSLAECQNRLAAGLVDCLMVVTGSGGTYRKLPENVGFVTIFFEAVNNSGQVETVSIRVRDLPEVEVRHHPRQ